MEDLKQSLSIQNIQEYKELIEKAKKESDQLLQTIKQIQEFEIEIELKS